MLRNTYIEAGEVVKIEVRRRGGEVYEVIVDGEVFHSALKDIDARVFLTPSHGKTLYASLLVRNGVGKFEKVLLHRHILNCPEFKIVDHINRNPLDNRLINLRIVGHLENMQNRDLQSNSSTGVRGVTRRSSGKYCARVRLNRKLVYYKQFDTLEAAELAVAKAREQLLPYSSEEAEAC